MALAGGVGTPEDADRIVLAWLTLLPVFSSPPQAAARLLRRHGSRPVRSDPGAIRLLDLLSFITRYGRHQPAGRGPHHQPEE